MQLHAVSLCSNDRRVCFHVASKTTYPERGGFSDILPEMIIFQISLRVRFRRIPRAEGIQMLYYTEKILGLKQTMQIPAFFGELERGCLAWYHE